jgi:hypothetical protein
LSRSPCQSCLQNAQCRMLNAQRVVHWTWELCLEHCAILYIVTTQ